MRFGLVGAGMIGQIRARSFKNLPGCDFVGVADLDRDRARSLATFPRTHVFDGYEQMLTSDEVDAIIVSTPPQFHEEMTIAALQARKHVLSENPPPNPVA